MSRLKRKKLLPSGHANDVRFGTPLEVAQYRAKRISLLKPDVIIEVGAGAGFQTAAFARAAKKVIAVEIDAQRLGRAKLAENVVPITGDAMGDKTIQQVRAHAGGNAVVFLDPQRPASAKQRMLSDIQPDIGEFIKKYSEFADAIAIELPPFLRDIPFDCEKEYISIDGKLNRLTIYCGRLKQANLSVVRLSSKGGMPAVIHADAAQQQESSAVDPIYLLEPDTALAHAGLVPAALEGNPAGRKIAVREIKHANRSAYLTSEKVDSPWFVSYRILAAGEKSVLARLAKCGKLTLHGSLSPDEQKALQLRLNRLCKGTQHLHLFIAEKWYLVQSLRNTT
jgi:hypothetical protein